MKTTNCITHFTANKMSTMQARYVDKKIKEAKNVDIICHDMTDRDGANSALAMWEYLKQQGISARVIISQKKPESLKLRTYDFDMVQASDDEELTKIKPDIAFCVDFGGSERVLPNVLKHINDTPLVMGFDHHSEVDVSRDNFVQFQRTLFDDEYVATSANFYSDMSAKSATCVVYRFFEALGKEIDNSQAYDLFLGLVDDIVKRSLVKCDGKNGTITPQKALIDDKNAYEIFEKLKSKLTQEQIAKIAKDIDILSSLTKEQEEFKNSLKEKIQYSKNGKIAYLEIKPDDKQWENLGGDNVVTSRILNNFRQEILADEEFKDVDLVIAFYEAHGNYRLSAHSRNQNLLKFFKYVEENAIENFTKNSGGHPTRGGGGINTIDKDACSIWVEKIISCDKYFQK